MNDKKEVEGVSHQVMRCILCYVDLVNVLNPRTKERKYFKTYYKTFGITTLKKYDADHFMIANFFKEGINNGIIKSVERQLAKKRPNVLGSAIFGFFCYKITFQQG